MFNVSKKAPEEDKETVEVEVSEDEVVEEDVGQIALDILEMDDSYVVVAPLA